MFVCEESARPRPPVTRPIQASTTRWLGIASAIPRDLRPPPKYPRPRAYRQPAPSLWRAIIGLPGDFGKWRPNRDVRQNRTNRCWKTPGPIRPGRCRSVAVPERKRRASWADCCRPLVGARLPCGKDLVNCPVLAWERRVWRKYWTNSGRAGRVHSTNRTFARDVFGRDDLHSFQRSTTGRRGSKKSFKDGVNGDPYKTRRAWAWPAR